MLILMMRNTLCKKILVRRNLEQSSQVKEVTDVKWVYEHKIFFTKIISSQTNFHDSISYRDGSTEDTTWSFWKKGRPPDPLDDFLAIHPENEVDDFTLEIFLFLFNCFHSDRNSISSLLTIRFTRKAPEFRQRKKIWSLVIFRPKKLRLTRFETPCV